MSEFGLTGGIGSGKSTVSAGLVRRGAALVDADATVRELQRPGTDVYKAIVAHFGEAVVKDDGELDRPALAAIVFSDAEALSVLNRLVHPAVREHMANQRSRLAEGDAPVILDIPLLVESSPNESRSSGEASNSSGYRNLAGIIVVDVDPEIALERLVRFRGFDASDARSRMANQVSRQDRLSKADFVVDNSHDLEHLETEIDRCWAWIRDRELEISEGFKEIL